MSMISERELEDAGYDASLAKYMQRGPIGDLYDELEYLLECAEMDAIFEADEDDRQQAGH